tara:strand:+ start:57 stop:272 length:216 start_codon:yes stop_codon:yes gene_type:complete
MTNEKKDLDMNNEMKSVGDLIKELQTINETLFSINNNIANLILVYQMHLMVMEESKKFFIDETEAPKKKLH